MADRALSIVRTPIALVGGGTTQLVAGVVGYRIHVNALVLTADAITHLTLQGAADLMDVYLAAGDGVVLPDCPGGWVRCASGSALLIISTAANVGGVVVHRMIPDHIEL